MKKLILAVLFISVGYAQPNCLLTTVRCAGTAQEYATLQLASNAAVAGDTVYAAVAEVYVGFAVISPHVSGSAGNPITYTAIAGSSITTAGNVAGDGINVDSVDYVVVDGFTVATMPRMGIRAVLTTGSVLKNNVITGAGSAGIASGILTGFAYRIQILTNTISGTISQHGIYVSNSALGFDGPIIRGNISHNNAGAGLQINGDCGTTNPSGNTDGMITGALVEGNVMYANGSGFSLINVSESTFRNNLLYSNTSAVGAIKLADQGCNLGTNNNVFSNNTLYSSFVGFRIVSGTGNILFNNLIVSDSYFCVIDATAASCDNAGSGGTGNYYQAGLERTVTASTGVFTNQAGSDYTLAASSPAIDIGIASYLGYAAPVPDLLNNGRPVGGGYDVGAYERGGSPLSPDTTPPTTPGTPVAVATASSVSLTWAVSTDTIQVVGYIVYRDGIPYASALLPTYTDTSVVPGATYLYAVYAYDAVPNISTASSVSATVFGVLGCMNADASFRNYIMPVQSGTFTFTMDSTPFGTTTINSVIGLARSTASAFGDMAVLIAFNASGNIQVRNGSTYTADITLPYVFLSSYHFRVVVNISTHTYTVFVTPPASGELTLATNYAFRTEQSSVTSLSYLSSVSDVGSVSVCSPAINGIPLAGISYLPVSTQVLSTQVTTSVLTDANGSGHPLLDIPKPTVLTTNYTLGIADNASLLYYAGSGAITVTVPTGLGAGFGCTIVRDGTGVVTVSGSGLTLIPAGLTQIARQGGAGVVQCTAANTCHLWGDVQ